MKEISDIIQAFDRATQAGIRSALATVVHLDGSSYRRPGARMLVTAEGRLTGAISGGCLEGDALRKAIDAIMQNENSLVTYDSTDEDDLKFGVQLGCNGIVHILFEPVDTGNPDNPIELLRAVTAGRTPAALLTLYSLHSSAQPGTAALYRAGRMRSVLAGAALDRAASLLESAIRTESSFHQAFTPEAGDTGAFVEYLLPPLALVIAGAGNDAIPLAEMGALLGWPVTVIDGRSSHAQPHRFPKANRVLVAKASGVLEQVSLDERTAVLLMTHNFNYDLSLLKELLGSRVGFVGLLGPAAKRERMFAAMQAGGIPLTAHHRQIIHGPIGLDIGAETAEEIAVSIVAGISAFFTRTSGGQLSMLEGPIHRNQQHPVDL